LDQTSAHAADSARIPDLVDEDIAERARNVRAEQLIGVRCLAMGRPGRSGNQRDVAARLSASAGFDAHCEGVGVASRVQNDRSSGDRRVNAASAGSIASSHSGRSRT
jgi:hypothetical protein